MSHWTSERSNVFDPSEVSQQAVGELKTCLDHHARELKLLHAAIKDLRDGLKEAHECISVLEDVVKELHLSSELEETLLEPSRISPDGALAKWVEEVVTNMFRSPSKTAELASIVKRFANSPSLFSPQEQSQMEARWLRTMHGIPPHSEVVAPVPRTPEATARSTGLMTWREVAENPFPSDANAIPPLENPAHSQRAHADEDSFKSSGEHTPADRTASVAIYIPTPPKFVLLSPECAAAIQNHEGPTEVPFIENSNGEGA